MRQRFRNLTQFLGGYFHQDWQFEAMSSEDVLLRFAHEVSKESLQAIAADIANLLQQDEELFHDIIEASGFCYDPRADGMSVRQWLAKVQELFRAT